MTIEDNLRIGIDVGGTNTDAVVVNSSNNVIAKTKTPTTSDIQSGISTALGSVLSGLTESVDRITHVMLGTTHATNAILERRDLNKVISVRVAGPASHAIPPLFDWPDELRHEVLAGAVIVDGGSELNGQELAKFDRGHLSRFLAQIDGEVDGAEELVLADFHPAVKVGEVHDAGEIGLGELDPAGDGKLGWHEWTC